MKLVILDRDGTINEDRDDYVKSPDEWVPIAGRARGDRTPQPCRLAHRGRDQPVGPRRAACSTWRRSNAIHAKMNRALAEIGGRIDAVFFCPHGPDDGCDCRKPLPGLFDDDRRALRRRPARDVPTVGDSLRDLQAGVAAGCAPHLVRTGKGALLDDDALRMLQEALSAHAVVHADLAAFAQQLIQRERQKRGDGRRGRLGVHRRSSDEPRARGGPLGRLRRLPDGDGRAVGDRGNRLFDLRPRRASVLGVRRLAAPLDLGARVRSAACARPCRASRTCPRRSVILLPKHQSTWETFAFPTLDAAAALLRVQA